MMLSSQLSQFDELGDVSTLSEPKTVDDIIHKHRRLHHRRAQHPSGAGAHTHTTNHK